MVVQKPLKVRTVLNPRVCYPTIAPERFHTQGNLLTVHQLLRFTVHHLHLPVPILQHYFVLSAPPLGDSPNKRGR